jgi:uncharacterized protein DUF6922
MKDERVRTTRVRGAVLPDSLRPLFWEHDFEALTWEADRDLIMARVLASGGWDAVRWLRSQLSDTELRDWIERRRGRGLSRQQLRFWELILGLPHRQVDAWLAEEGRQIWQERTGEKLGSIRERCDGEETKPILFRILPPRRPAGSLGPRVPPIPP